MIIFSYSFTRVHVSYGWKIHYLRSIQFMRKKKHEIWERKKT